MSEQKPERKVVGRTMAIVLGIICIVLAVSLVGAVMNYTSVIRGKDDFIEGEESDIANKSAQISQLNYQVDNLTGIINLSKSKVWVNHETITHEAGYLTYWTFSASYAGYVSVRIDDDNTTSTYVRTIYSAYGVKYNNQIDVVATGKALFPILPSSGIEVRIGNNLLIGATENVTITYYY